jgi:hypothetical protein
MLGLRANDVTWKYFSRSVTVRNRKFRIINPAENPVKLLLVNKAYCEFLACGVLQFILLSAAVLRQING